MIDGNWRIKDITGNHYGKLVVIRHTEKRNGRSNLVVWKLQCDCGNVIERDVNWIKARKTPSCGCDPHRGHDIGPDSSLWTGVGEISGQFWARIRKNAKNRNRVVEVSLEDLWELFLKQDRKCALSGVPLFFHTVYNDPCAGTASLDRINSSLDYVKGNVQWVHKRLNIMKQDTSDEEFIEWCRKVVQKADS